jgi:hypothetical protein
MASRSVVVGADVSPWVVMAVPVSSGSDATGYLKIRPSCPNRQGATRASELAGSSRARALFELGDGVAHAVLTLARTRTGFFEDGSRAVSARVGVKLSQHGPTGGPLS